MISDDDYKSELLTCEEWKIFSRARFARGKQNYIKASPSEIYDAFVELDKARQRIRELEEMQRWIPVTEKLPEVNLPVITIYWTQFGQSSQVIRALLDTGMWFEVNSGFLANKKNITHWRPLPEPPQDKE